jgi:cell division protein FtsQ
MAREPAATRRGRAELDRPNALRLWLRRQRPRLRPIGYGLLGLGLLGGAGLAVQAMDPGGRLMWVVENAAEIGRDAGLRVRHVIVEGQQNTPMELLRAALGVSGGDPILAFSPQAAKERLEMLSWVQTAHVERHLPTTILVRLQERRPFAIWQHQNRFAVIDREGKVVATDALDSFGPLPLVVGAGAERYAAALYDLLRRHKDVAARTQALVRIGERRWNLRLHNGTDVLLPEGQEAPALERLAELQRDQRLLDRPLVAVDMRLPDRLVLRQPPPAQEQHAPPARRNAGGSGRG